MKKKNVQNPHFAVAKQWFLTFGSMISKIICGNLGPQACIYILLYIHTYSIIYIYIYILHRGCNPPSCLWLHPQFCWILHLAIENSWLRPNPTLSENMAPPHLIEITTMVSSCIFPHGQTFTRPYDFREPSAKLGSASKCTGICQMQPLLG